MLNRTDLHQYQLTALQHVKQTKKCALFLDMGLGKTATALTAISDFIEDKTITKTLVIAPLRVARTVWKQEAAKWSHLSHLRVSVCVGTAKQRIKALNADADVYVINPDTIVWLVKEYGQNWVWDMLVVDESSKFKSHSAKRFKALQKVLHKFISVVLLTGTPSPNGLMDLWAQIHLLDGGKRLGNFITHYRNKYFQSYGYQNYQYRLLPGSKEKIQAAIADICISMKAADWLELPAMIKLRTEVELPPKALEQYNSLRKDFLLHLNDVDITAQTAAVLGNKLLQVCNGVIYDEHNAAHVIHDAKLDALKEIVDENPNENFLVAYNFKTDLARIKVAFPDAVVLGKGTKELDDWNNGKTRMLLVHPASAGHGLNAQYGGCVVVWFGLTWSLENYLQLNARLHRQGQTKTVRVMHIVAKGKMDEKVLRALSGKNTNQNALLASLKADLMDEYMDDFNTVKKVVDKI